MWTKQSVTNSDTVRATRTLVFTFVNRLQANIFTEAPKLHVRNFRMKSAWKCDYLWVWLSLYCEQMRDIKVQHNRAFFGSTKPKTPGGDNGYHYRSNQLSASGSVWGVLWVMGLFFHTVISMSSTCSNHRCYQRVIMKWWLKIYKEHKTHKKDETVRAEDRRSLIRGQEITWLDFSLYRVVIKTF